MSDLRVAIIGYGLAGRSFHAPLIAATPGAGGGERRDLQPGPPGAGWPDEHPHAQLLSGPEELWELASAHELVVLATPNDAHVPLALQALEHRLPVVVDKPLAL